MAEINFLPVCSACGSVIDEEIDYREAEYSENRQNNGFTLKHACEIVPRRCPKCAEWFDRITMPTKLPYSPDRRPI